MQYPVRAGKAIGRLMSPYNDIDIYVEDISYVGLYERLINKSLRGKAKVSKVIPLGGRRNVELEAKNDNGNGGKPRIYIVDGDLDVAAKYKMRSPPMLHRLKVYSIENVLLERKALESYLTFSCPTKSSDDAVKAVDLPSVESEIENGLSLYILALAVARRLDLRDDAFKMRAQSLFEMENGKAKAINPKLLNSAVFDVISKIKQLTNIKKYRKTKEDVKRIIKTKNLTGMHYCPGKVMLWFLNERVGGTGGMSLQQRAVASYLADHCTLSLDAGLGRRLRRLAALVG